MTILTNLTSTIIEIIFIINNNFCIVTQINLYSLYIIIYVHSKNYRNITYFIQNSNLVLK